MCGRTLQAPSPVKSTLKALVEQGIDALREQGSLPADVATPDFVIGDGAPVSLAARGWV